MGYKRNRTYLLVFEDPQFEGLEVRARDASVGSVLRITRLLGDNPMENLEEIADIFAVALLSWNLEDEDGQPVPTTRDGLLAQDMDLLTGLVDAWMTATAGVAPPLPVTSTGGGTSVEASLPMEALSASQAS